MHQKSAMFVTIGIKKVNFHIHFQIYIYVPSQDSTILRDVNIGNILVSKKIFFGQKNYNALLV